MSELKDLLRAAESPRNQVSDEELAHSLQTVENEWTQTVTENMAIRRNFDTAVV